MKRILLALLILSAACHGDEPKVDENGCWLDAEEAYITVIEAGCKASLKCHPDVDSALTLESCISNGIDGMEYYRENSCFDGCTMNTCLERFAAYEADCSTEADIYYCYDETFYDGLDKACVERPW